MFNNSFFKNLYSNALNTLSLVAIVVLLCSCDKQNDDLGLSQQDILIAYDEDLKANIIIEPKSKSSIICGKDSIDNGYIVIGEFLEDGTWNTSLQTYISFNSDGYPVYLYNEDVLAMISYKDNCTIDAIYFSEDGTYQKTSYSYTYKSNINKFNSRASSDTYQDIYNSITGAKSLIDLINAGTNGAKLSSILGVIGALTEGGLSTLTSGLSGFTQLFSDAKGGIASLGYLLAWELWIRNRKYVEEHAGNLNMNLEEVILTEDLNIIKLPVLVSGIRSDTDADLSLNIHWVNITTGAYGDFVSSEKVINKFYNFEIEIAGEGEYMIYVFISCRCCPLTWTKSKTVNIKNDERLALIKFFNDTNGSEWITNTNWCSDAPMSEWYGIKLDSTGHITEINLKSNNLNGNNVYLNLYNFPNLLLFNIDNNFISNFHIQNNGNIETLKLYNSINKEISFSGFPNVEIDHSKLTALSGSCEYLSVKNCDFGDAFCPFSGVNTIDAYIYNCNMHSCGLSSQTLKFVSSSTYNTWYCNTAKRLDIINSHCSTICGGDFKYDTILHFENASLWRSNWDEDSQVTLNCTTTGAGWYNLF